MLKSLDQINIEDRVLIAKTLLCREIDGEALLLEQERGYYYGLDEVGTRMFELIRRHRDLTTVRERLLEEYEVEAAVLERDLLALVRDLREHRLLEVQHGEVGE